MIAANIRLSIEGKEVVLIRDVIGKAPSEKYTRQDEGSLHIWYEETVLTETREANPDAKVYGLWQTLIASGVIDLDQKLQVLYTNDSKDIGYYLYINSGVMQSGSIFNSELQSLPSSALTEEFSLDDAIILNSDESTLKLPAEQLKTQKEIVKQSLAKKKSNQQRSTMTVVLIIACGLAMDTFLDIQHEKQAQLFSALENKLTVTQGELASLAKRKRYNIPSQKETLTKLYNVTDSLHDEALSANFSLKSNEIVKVFVKNTNVNAARISMLASGDIQTVRVSPEQSVITWVNKNEN